MTLKLAIFDCDGTLIDSQFSINMCMSEAFKMVGMAPPDIAEVRRVVGLPLAEAITRLCPEGEGAPIERMSEAYSQAWMQLRADAALEEPIFDGMRELLEVLQDAGWLLAVATGKSSRGLKATLDHHGLEEFFVTLQTADTARGKPDPEMIERALHDTGAHPSDTWMIGDTTFDMEMAKAAKVSAIGVEWGYHAPSELRAAGALFMAKNADELRTILISAKEKNDE